MSSRQRHVYGSQTCNPGRDACVLSARSQSECLQLILSVIVHCSMQDIIPGFVLPAERRAVMADFMTISGFDLADDGNEMVLEEIL